MWNKVTLIHIWLHLAYNFPVALEYDRNVACLHSVWQGCSGVVCFWFLDISLPCCMSNNKKDCLSISSNVLLLKFADLHCIVLFLLGTTDILRATKCTYIIYKFLFAVSQSQLFYVFHYYLRLLSLFIQAQIQ